MHIKKLQKPKINTAIVISTTKKYEFIWETFFTLLYKHWPKCEYPIFLISDGNPKKLTTELLKFGYQLRNEQGHWELKAHE